MTGAMRLRRAGFTLVEVVLAMVLLGIVGAMVAVFIRAPVQGYLDSAARAELGDQADLALRRMARDLRLALPNSIRVDGTGAAIEFMLTKSGGRYLASDDGVAGQVLDFSVAANRTFAVVGAMPSLNRNIAVNDLVVVNNLGRDLDPGDAYKFGSGSPRNVAQVEGFAQNAAGEVTTITLRDNPFAGQSPALPSETHRFHLVAGPVTYYCGADPDVPGTFSLWRMWGYPVTANQAVPPSGTGLRKALIARRVNSCAGLFRYDVLSAAQRSGLVILSLPLRPRNDTAAVVRLVHQVHVDNTP